MIRSPWGSLAPYPREPLWAHLATAAERFSQKAALVGTSGRLCTFGELWDLSRSVAGYLQFEGGVARGDRVAVTTEASREFLAAMYGALLAGATVAAANPQFGPRDMAARLETVGPRVVIASPRAQATIAELEAGGNAAGRARVFPLEGLSLTAGEYGRQPEPVALDVDSDLALLGYTSGTGGLPKAVPHSHAAQAASARQRAATGRGGEHSVVLGFHPLWFTIQLTVLTGATCVEASGLDPDETLALCERERVTEIYGRPFSLETLIEAYDRHPRDLPLRLIETSGTPLSLHLATEAERRFRCPIRQAYHLSEGTGSVNRPKLEEANAETVGYPVPDTEEKIVDPDTLVEVPVGEIGELMIRGPQVARGYWNRPEETAETFLADGWLRTGDVARQDVEGRVYIVDRLKDVMKVYGRQVAPAEIEAVLAEHPAIRESAVVGVPFPGAGEVPKAFVVLNEGQHVTLDELATFVATRLASFKMIQEVELVDRLPRGPGGKLLRRALVPRA